MSFTNGLKKVFAFTATALVMGGVGETIAVIESADKGLNCGKDFVTEAVREKADPITPVFKAADSGMDSFKILALGSLATLVVSLGGGLLVAGRVGNT